MIVRFEDLRAADLIPGTVYEGGEQNNLGADPLARLLPVGNQGGIRFKGRVADPDLVILKTTWAELEWPDHFDHQSGVLIYYGDNRRVDSPLSKPRGNQCLEAQFKRLHSMTAARQGVAPTLVFETLVGRSVRFIGLAVPGALGMSARDDLVAFWTTTRVGAFLNYRATFTVWPHAVAPRTWLDEVAAGGDPRQATGCPEEFARWLDRGTY